MARVGEPVSLQSILAEFPYSWLPVEIPDVAVTGIAIDSRKVAPGNLFVARPGGAMDGHEFIPEAIARGASAIVGERMLKGLSVPYIKVEKSLEAVTWLAAAFHGFPGRRLTVIGVTGTDGKTTTCNLLYQIMRAAGIQAGLISTVNAVIGDDVLDTGFHVTTPDAPDVQYYLARMVAAGMSHVILETTSHGLVQHRVDASQYDVAVLTNITHEHIDQHGSYENYRAAKGRLFQLLEKTSPKEKGNLRLAVINRDDSSYAYLREHMPPSIKVIAYSCGEEADLKAESIVHSPKGIRFEAVSETFREAVASSLVGEFNVSNCLAAMAAAIFGVGIEPGVAARGVAAMAGVPGRMERIDLGQSFTAIVDFAHTPNALRAAITTARMMTTGRVITVFGSAGLRDKEKRGLMAETSARLADISILTAEDPRTESLTDILDEMAVGARAGGGIEGETFFLVPDRSNAIRSAIRKAVAGDIIIACGKGHEQSMCFGEVEYPWDDRQAMRAALAEYLGLSGPKIPYLPTQEREDGDPDPA